MHALFEAKKTSREVEVQTKSRMAVQAKVGDRKRSPLPEKLTEKAFVSGESIESRREDVSK